MAPLLSVKDLSLQFLNAAQVSENSYAIHNVSFDIEEGKTHALVGESGSGKSVTALSILRLLEEISNTATTGEITFNNTRIDQLDTAGIRSLRGNDIAMIFQEPMTSLNPV